MTETRSGSLAHACEHPRPIPALFVVSEDAR